MEFQITQNVHKPHQTFEQIWLYSMKNRITQNAHEYYSTKFDHIWILSNDSTFENLESDQIILNQVVREESGRIETNHIPWLGLTFADRVSWHDLQPEQNWWDLMGISYKASATTWENLDDDCEETVADMLTWTWKNLGAILGRRIRIWERESQNRGVGTRSMPYRIHLQDTRSD